MTVFSQKFGGEPFPSQRMTLYYRNDNDGNIC